MSEFTPSPVTEGVYYQSHRSKLRRAIFELEPGTHRIVAPLSTSADTVRSAARDILGKNNFSCVATPDGWVVSRIP